MSDILLPAFLILIVLFFLLGTGVWVAISLIAVATLSIVVFASTDTGALMASTIWGHSNLWSLAALPLFIWMGDILFRSRLSDDMFEGLQPWMGGLPGKLLHVNIIGCGIFAAVSGSSAATAATIGKISIPELKRRGYDEKMILGTLAGSATLGLLIPPSIILIVYGVATEQSIARLFVAGVGPGIMLVGMFMAFVAIWSFINKDRMPGAKESFTWKQRFNSIKSLGPVVLLILGVIGSIYTGIASPTDAAAVGVFLALCLTKYTGDLTKETFIDGILSATRTSCMIAFILAGAAFLTTAMGFTGIPASLASWIGEMNLSHYQLLGALTVFFIIMGCFLDGISVVVLTTAVILPMVEAAGIDPLWFGIFIVIVVEMSQITPPVGFNLFVIQSLSGRNILVVAKAALPFFLILIAAVGLITVFPEIVTWLPNNMS